MLNRIWHGKVASGFLKLSGEFVLQVMKQLFSARGFAVVVHSQPVALAQVAGGALLLVDDKQAKTLMDAGDVCFFGHFPRAVTNPWHSRCLP